MKNLFSRLPKKVLFATALVAVVFGAGAVAKAWYPNRPTYTVAHPADHVTFDSITDNPREGDERAFFSMKNAADTNSDGFLHQTTVKDGETVLLRVYVHNNAATSLNTVPDGKGGYKGVATNAKLRVWLPSVTDSVLRANAYITADNAQPQEVSDTVDFVAPTTANKFSLSYVPGSAVAYNNFAGKDGLKLSDKIVTTGALLGEKTANGVIPGCFEYVNVVTLKVKVHMQVPKFTLQKTVAKLGTTNYVENLTAQPGETVGYQLAFANTGNTTLKNVVLRDQLPDGVKIVSGTAKLYNSNSSSAQPQTDAIVANGGQNIGNYAATANAYFRFRATMPTADKLKCGTNVLTNTAQAIVNGQDVTDTAKVTITKKCVTPAPEYSCNLLTLAKHDNRKVTATVAHSQKNGATYKSATINWGDGTTNNSLTHQYSKDGTYHVAATANFTVKGATKSATSEKCKGSVTYKTTPPAKPVYSCDLLSVSQGDNRTVTASVSYTAQNGATFKAVTYNWGDNTTPYMTNNATAQHTYAADGTYAITAKVLFSVNGKDVEVMNDCASSVTFSTPTPPVTPPELPNTGAGNVIGLFVGAVLAGTIGYRLFLSRKLAR